MESRCIQHSWRFKLLIPCSDDRIEIANFVEAAHEWGSTVLVPKSEFERMKVLTSGRLVADDKREATDLDPRRAPPREPDPSLKEIVNNPGLYHV